MILMYSDTKLIGGVMKVKRFFAKASDYLLFGATLSRVVELYIPYIDPWIQLIGALCIPLLYVPFEALQLYLFQTTLGKALIGLKVCENGRFKISGKGAFRSAFSLFKQSPCHTVTQTRKKRGRVVSAIGSLALMGGCTFSNFLLPGSLGGSGVTLNKGWIRFVSKEGRFSIDMPRAPEVQMSEFPVPPAGITLSMSVYNAPVDDEATEYYTVSHVTLPRSWLLAGSKKILFSGLYLKYETRFGSDVLSKKLTSHWEKYPAVDFVAKVNGKFVQGRLVLVGNKLFQVTKTGPKKAQMTAESPEDNFIISFNPTVI